MNRKANAAVVGILIVLVLLGAGGFIASQMMKTTPPASVSPSPIVNGGDIDRSGVADEGDRMLVQKNIGCEKANPCWNSTIGKTKDGDNPLYVFDLDLDKDGSISQKDVDLVK